MTNDQKKQLIELLKLICLEDGEELELSDPMATLDIPLVDDCVLKMPMELLLVD